MAHSLVYQPVVKRSRRLGTKVIPKADKYLTRRAYSPGQHGPRGRRRLTDYAARLIEKQKAKFFYAIRERQFRKLFEQAGRQPGPTGENLLKLLESRLDNVIFRAGLAKTHRQARQLISHRHFLLNGHRVSIPSILLKKGDEITPYRIGWVVEEVVRPGWLKFDKKTQKITILRSPDRQDITTDVNEQRIVEYYSR